MYIYQNSEIKPTIDEYTCNHERIILELCNILEKFRLTTNKVVVSI